MKVKLVFDPLDIWNSKEQGNNIILFQDKPQFELRCQYEKLRDLDADVFLVVKDDGEALLQNLPDIRARVISKEILAPSRLTKEELGITLDPVLDQVLKDKSVFESFKNFLKANSSLFKTIPIGREETLDLLLEGLHGIPPGELPIGLRYKFLKLMPLMKNEELQERLRTRLKSPFLDCLQTPDDIVSIRDYFWLSILFSLYGKTKALSPKTILGAKIERYKSIPTEVIIQAFRDISNDKNFLKEELKSLSIGPKVNELLELIDIDKERLLKEGLEHKLKTLEEKAMKGEEINESVLYALKEHLFSDDFKEKIEALWIYRDLREDINTLEKELEKEGYRSPQALKEFFARYVSPFLLRWETLEMQGQFKLPKVLNDRIKEFLQNLDKLFAELLKECYSDIIKNKRDTILSFPSFLRETYKGSQGRCIVVFVDALSYDLWLYLVSKLQEIGFSYEGEPVFSILPTETRFNKTSLFLGYRTEGLEPDIDDLAGGLGIEKEKVHFEKVAGGMSPNVLRSVLEDKEWKVLILSYNTIDERIKERIAIGDLLRATEELFNKLNPLWEKAKKEQIPIIVVSDHGLRELDPNRVLGLAPSDEDVLLEKNLLRWRSKISIDALPEDCMELEGRLFAVGGATFRKTPLRYAHGGISLREMVVPIARVFVIRKELVEPEVELVTQEVSEKEEATISFEISNKGKMPLHVHAFTLDLTDTMEDVWIPSIRDFPLEPFSEKRLSFTVHVGKIEEFSQRNEIDMVVRAIGVSLEYSYPGEEISKLKKQFELYIKRSIRVVERGAFEREIEL
jgi:hypothetical protein